MIWELMTTTFGTFVTQSLYGQGLVGLLIFGIYNHQNNIEASQVYIITKILKKQSFKKALMDKKCGNESKIHLTR